MQHILPHTSPVHLLASERSNNEMHPDYSASLSYIQGALLI